MKITEYPKISEFTNDQVMLVDGNDGTKQAALNDAIYGMFELLPYHSRKMIYRGKNLGSRVTDTQLAAIRNGSFKDLWVGDYWDINNIIWRIVDINYWRYAYSTTSVPNHLVIMPVQKLYDAKMNDTATTAGGYVNSKMRTTYLNQAKTMVTNAFGDIVLSRREYFVNTITGDYQTNGEWVDSTVDIPSEFMIYGSYIYSLPDRTATRYNLSRGQLALFKIDPTFITWNQMVSYWLRDVTSSSSFAGVTGTGSPERTSANTSTGVKPVFAIG